jgi:hypothetical protein
MDQVIMTPNALTWLVIATTLMGILAGALLTRIVWSICTDEGERRFPKIRIFWER